MATSAAARSCRMSAAATTRTPLGRRLPVLNRPLSSHTTRVCCTATTPLSFASFTFSCSSSSSSLWTATKAAGVSMNMRTLSTAPPHGNISEHTIQVNNVKLYCMSAKPDGPSAGALLCMPGAMGTAETDFGPQLRGLSTEFEVVSFDPRGYGKSRPPKRDFPVGFYQRDADDAAALMSALGHQKYSVMGWSDGAMSAVLLAAENPEAVERLVIFGGNAYLKPTDIEAFEATRDIYTSWSKRMLDTHLPTYGDDLQPMWSAAINAWAEIVEAGGDVCQTAARNLRCPTLILHGAKDPICLSEHPEWFLNNIPDARLKVYDEGKHNLHLRFADDVNEDVRSFLREM